MNFNVFAALSGIVPFLMLCFWGATIIVHSAFALAVDFDAARLARSGRDTVLVGRFIWSLATLVGGPLVAAAYWIMHRSALQIASHESHAPE